MGYTVRCPICTKAMWKAHTPHGTVYRCPAYPLCQGTMSVRDAARADEPPDDYDWEDWF